MLKFTSDSLSTILYVSHLRAVQGRVHLGYVFSILILYRAARSVSSLELSYYIPMYVKSKEPRLEIRKIFNNGRIRMMEA